MYDKRILVYFFLLFLPAVIYGYPFQSLNSLSSHVRHEEEVEHVPIECSIIIDQLSLNNWKLEIVEEKDSKYCAIISKDMQQLNGLIGNKETAATIIVSDDNIFIPLLLHNQSLSISLPLGNEKPVLIRIIAASFENKSYFPWFTSWSDISLFIILILPSVILYVLYLVWRWRKQVQTRTRTQNRTSTPDIVYSLPIYKFHREKDVPMTHHQVEQEDKECPICLEEYQQGDKIRILPCKHEFHSVCVDIWLIRKKFCPICKYDVCKKKYQVINENTPLLSA